MELSLQPLDYSSYYLGKNPFPYVGVPDDEIQVYTNRQSELKQIGDAVKGTLKGTSSHVIIVGNYGNGKTSTLKYVGNQISNQIKSGLTLYLSYPGESFLELYSNMIYQIGMNEFENLVWKYLEVANNISDLKMKAFQGEVLLPTIIENGRMKLYNSLDYNDFATSFLHMILKETRFIAWKYLCGEPILVDQKKELDVVSLIDTDEKALRAFLSLKKILNEVGITLLCLLIDEVESIETLHILRKQKILNSLRRLMDLNPKGLCLLFACTPEAWSNIISDYHAFSERIFRNVVLRPLDNEMLRQLIIDYLNLNRTVEANPESDIFPFDGDSLDDILFIAQGNVRRVLRICNRVIEYSLERGYDQISNDHLRQLFPEFFTNQDE